jgi:hypothetical protein
MLPSPTAEPAAAKIKPSFEFHEPRSVVDVPAKRCPPLRVV